MKMLDKYKIDLHSWKRKDHYTFFKNFEQPFFGTIVYINCTSAYHWCKTHKVPFYCYYIHKSLYAVNQLKEFRYRIEHDEVVEYAKISGSVSVLRKDETFSFCYFDYHTSFQQFMKEIKTAVEKEKTSQGLDLRAVNDLIHYSVLPGIQFQGFQHAQHLSGKDSVPKIVFGKFEFRNGQVLLPVAVHVHHALCDGFHVGKFIEIFQSQMEVNR